MWMSGVTGLANTLACKSFFLRTASSWERHLGQLHWAASLMPVKGWSLLCRRPSGLVDHVFVLYNDACWKDRRASWAQQWALSIRKKPSQWRNESNGLTGRCPLIFSGLWAQLANTYISADCILKWSWGQLCKNVYTWPKGNSIKIVDFV